jgi:hypothetical protein
MLSRTGLLRGNHISHRHDYRWCQKPSSKKRSFPKQALRKVARERGRTSRARLRLSPGASRSDSRANEGHYSVSASTFVGLHHDPAGWDHDTCEYRVIDRGYHFGYIHSGTEQDSCYAMAQLQLPDGAEITGVSCRVHDATTQGRIRVWLQTHDPENMGDWLREYRWASQISSGGGSEETITIDTVMTPYTSPLRFVNNAEFYYLLRVEFQSNGFTRFDDFDNSTEIGALLKLYGCTVKYRY